MVRTSLSLIILAMIQNPTKKKGMEGSACYQVKRCWCFSSKKKVSDTMSGNATRGGDDEEGELDWDNVQVGFVFSSFSWGYMTTQVKLFHECCEVVSSQILGGRLAELYGFKKVR